MSRISTPVVLDGVSDEQLWSDIVPLPAVMFLPETGADPTERTEIRLAHDDEFFYVSGRLYDSDPGRIGANSKMRDSEDASSDWFGIVIDSFNDNENAVAFFTTPTGLRWDAAVADDAQPVSPWGDVPINTNWDSYWDVATTRTDEGWFAEIRIPLSSLRFQDDDGRAVMGLISWRRIARKEEVLIFPGIPRDWGFFGSFKPSRARDCVLEGVHSRRTLYAVPYALSGVTRVTEVPDSTDGFSTERYHARELGLDIKYGLTSNLTLDATVNTDFAQVEADNQEVNLERYSLFFPEKRRFFQERASNFDFTFIGPNRLFYSRRIGMRDDERTRIIGGARVVGRVGVWDLGALSMQTAAEGDTPGENHSVIRLRRGILNPYSYVGGIATARVGTDGTYSVAYGADTRLRLFGNDYLTIKWAQTTARGDDLGLLSLEKARVHANWEKRGNRGFGYFFGFSHAGARYDPALGFENREDYRSASTEIRHGWYPSASSRLLSHQVLVNGYVVVRNADGVLETADFGPAWRFETKSGVNGSISPRFSYEQIPEHLELTKGTDVPAGAYSFQTVEANLSTPDGKRFAVGVDFAGGTFYDGDRVSLTLRNRWQASASVEFHTEYVLNRVNFAERAQSLMAHIGRLRLRVMPSTKLSLSGFFQYGSDSGDLTANVRLRYNPREGTDLYLVYDEGLDTRTPKQLPGFPLSVRRTLMVKYTHSLVI